MKASSARAIIQLLRPKECPKTDFVFWVKPTESLLNSLLDDTAICRAQREREREKKEGEGGGGRIVLE